MTLFTDIWSHDILWIKLLVEHPLAQRPQLLGVGFATHIVFCSNCCEQAAFWLRLAGLYTSAGQELAEEVRLGRTS
jgi:hypothetical protein